MWSLYFPEIYSFLATFKMASEPAKITLETSMVCFNGNGCLTACTYGLLSQFK